MKLRNVTIIESPIIDIDYTVLLSLLFKDPVIISSSIVVHPIVDVFDHKQLYDFSSSKYELASMLTRAFANSTDKMITIPKWESKMRRIMDILPYSYLTSLLNRNGFSVIGGSAVQSLNYKRTVTESSYWLDTKECKNDYHMLNVRNGIRHVSYIAVRYEDLVNLIIYELILRRQLKIRMSTEIYDDYF